MSVKGEITSEDAKLLYGGRREKYYNLNEDPEEQLGKRCFKATLLCCCCILTLMLFFIVLTSMFFILTWTGVLGNECELEWEFRNKDSLAVYNAFSKAGNTPPFKLNGQSQIFLNMNVTKTNSFNLVEDMYVEVYRQPGINGTRVYASSFFKYLHWDFGQTYRGLQQLANLALSDEKIMERKLSRYC
jgi:hypothetical protein